MQTLMKKTGLMTAIAALLILVAQTLIARAGSAAANLFTYDGIDPNGRFAWISVHHIVQAVIALGVMWILSRFLKLDWYLRLGDKKTGLRSVAWFAAIFLGYTLVVYIIEGSLGSLNSYDFPLNTRNIMGTLGFQLLLSGPSEEILFRAFPIAILTCTLQREIGIRFFKWHISLPVIIAAVFFAVAHISWSITKFYISFDPFQLVYAFVLGIIYGVIYQKSKSVLYPMMVHSISNFIMVGVGYCMASLNL